MLLIQLMVSWSASFTKQGQYSSHISANLSPSRRPPCSGQMQAQILDGRSVMQGLSSQAVLSLRLVSVMFSAICNTSHEGSIGRVDCNALLILGHFRTIYHITMATGEYPVNVSSHTWTLIWKYLYVPHLKCDVKWCNQFTLVLWWKACDYLLVKGCDWLIGWGQDAAKDTNNKFEETVINRISSVRSSSGALKALLQSVSIRC